MRILPIFYFCGTDLVFTFSKKVSNRNRVFLALIKKFEGQETLGTRLGHINLSFDYPRLIGTTTKKMDFFLLRNNNNR